MRLHIDEQYRNIRLVEKKSDPFNTSGALKATFPGRKVCVCDFYVDNCETSKEEQMALHYDDILIIDHHAPLGFMARRISSATIANRYVQAHGPLGDGWVIVINHTDADAILSALIMGGQLKPLEAYEKAAIAADHTGEENLIADLLQALERNRDVAKSVEVLEAAIAGGYTGEENTINDLLQGLESDGESGRPDKALEALIARRIEARHELRALADSGGFKWKDGIAFVILKHTIDAGLVPAVLPRAKAILVASPMPPCSAKAWRIRLRLGRWIDGIQLNTMKLPDFGGRWNAGSTSRHGGTNVEPEDYVRLARFALRQAEEGRAGGQMTGQLVPISEEARRVIERDAGFHGRTRMLVDEFESCLATKFPDPSAQSTLGDAFNLMMYVHVDQERPDGEPYANHPLDVAVRLMEDFGLCDLDMVVAALLHDTADDQAGRVLEYCAGADQSGAASKDLAISAIEQRFGKRTAEFVTKLSNSPEYESAPNRAERRRVYFQDFVALWKSDVHAAAIKVADFSGNALRLKMVSKESKRVELQAKYRPVVQFLIEELTSLDDPSHPLYPSKDSLVEVLGRAEEQDYHRRLLISLCLKKLALSKEPILWDGIKFKPKREVHITVIGSNLEEKLQEAIKRDPSIASLLDEAVVGAAWYRDGWKYEKTAQIYHMVKKEEERDSEGTVREVRVESIIQMVKVPGIQEFYERIGEITGERHEAPPAHVTLYTHGHPCGIGLPDQAAFERCVRQKISPDELEELLPSTC